MSLVLAVLGMTCKMGATVPSVVVMTITMKICARCESTKLATDFKPAARMRDGLDSWCRGCRKTYDKARGLARRKSDRIGRPPKLILDGERLVCGTCHETKTIDAFVRDATTPSGRNSRCKECCAAAAAAYYRKNRTKRIANAAAWNKANPERRREIEKAKRRRDTSYRIACYLRSRVSNALRRQLNGESVVDKRCASAVRDLGCTIGALMAHLEARFAPGMSWESYGAWHIDHVQPLASFDLTDPAQLRRAVHYTNLQPLWGPDNLKKGSKPPGGS